MASGKDLPIAASDEVLLIGSKLSAHKTKKSAKKSKCSPASLCVILLLLATLGFVLYAWFVIASQRDCVGVIQHEILTGKVYLSGRNSTENPRYFGKIGKNVNGWSLQRRVIRNGFEYSWMYSDIRLQIRKHDELNCTSIKWDYSTIRDNKYPIDCFSLTGSNWFGGSELYDQIWPLEGVSIDFAPYYPQDIILSHFLNQPAFGPVLGRYWITSLGSAVLANQSSPLVVSINVHEKGHLCLSIDPTKYPDDVPAMLEYKICQDKNVKAVHQTMLQNFFRKPTKAPDLRMIQQPVWSTWVKYNKGVNQTDVESFLQQIISNKFPCSQIEIDDMYSTEYGDFDFNLVKFPDPKGMIEKIHKAGCRLTVWVYPFANLFSKAYQDGKVKGYFVEASDGVSPGLMYWWDGVGAAVDFTNPEANDWYLTRLQDFQKTYNIDSFKFDGGSLSYLPYQYQLNNTKAMPSDYAVAYATLASKINNMVEVRVADNSQNLPVFVRFLDRNSDWSTTMGLQSVVPTVLTFGILGYPFVLPDMIGGNGKPDKELFIRWLQLNIFLPSMQFSHVPWDFDNDTTVHAQELMVIRQQLNATFVNGVTNAVKTGEPIIRPLWWVAPDDPVALKVNQQFMVADDYLVAPVTQSNASSISIYLPEGVWMEQFGNMVVHNVTTGGYLKYPVTLYDVFYFKNVTQLVF